MRIVTAVPAGMVHLTYEAECAFDHLQGYNLHLQAYWRGFKRLFRGNGELVPIFIASAGDFFVLVENAFMEKVLQMLRVMSDPAITRTARSPNASINGLLHAVYGPKSDSAPPELSRIAAVLTKQVGLTRQFVNRSIAHSDWNVVSGLDHIESIPMDQIEDALTTLEQFLNTFAQEFRLPRRNYDVERMDNQIARLMELLAAGVAALPTEANP